LNQMKIFGLSVAIAVAGGLTGYVIGYRRGAESAQSAGSVAAPAAAAPAAPAMPPMAAMPTAAVPSLEIPRRIEANRRLVAENPKDRQAWVQLGNDYFDTHQRDQAIEAYARALELEPNDPNVITDQGVMYRELGKHDQAIANFERANKIAPDHMQSLFNLGVVWVYDKKDAAKGATAWRKIIDTAPSSPQAAQARQAIKELNLPAP
jgi:cytochrome c-type biogenesis protein CcmH/NrfG